MLRYVVIALFALVPLAAQAGTTGGLCGKVLDFTTNAPIADARVTVTSSVQVETTRTDAHGGFVFASLVPGRYSIAISHPGFVTTISYIPIAADATIHPTLYVDQRKATSRGAGNLVAFGTSFTFHDEPRVEHPDYAIIVYGDGWEPDYGGPGSFGLYMTLTPGITPGSGPAVMH